MITNFNLYENIKIIKKEKFNNLGKEFGIELHNNIIDKDIYDVFKNKEKIGYLIISNDHYDHFDFQLDGKIVYLDWIEINEPGYLRKVMNLLKYKLKEKYDYLILEISCYNYITFQQLKKKYESIGFIGIIPENISEFDLNLCNEIDKYDDFVFMYLKIN